jgi:hypothetical protein
MRNNKVSSALSMWKENTGGIKKKFQINALRIAVSKTGKISNKIAAIETAIIKMSATTLYPIK